MPKSNIDTYIWDVSTKPKDKLSELEKAYLDLDAKSEAAKLADRFKYEPEKVRAIAAIAYSEAARKLAVLEPKPSEPTELYSNDDELENL